MNAAKLSEALSLLVQRSYGHSGEWLRTSDVRMLLDDPDHALAVFRARCAGAGVPATSRDVFEGYCDAACDYPIRAGQPIRTEIIDGKRMISHESCPAANLTDACDDQEALTEVVTLAIYEGKSIDPDPTEDIVDAVLAAGFRRDPDAGLRERVEELRSTRWHAIPVWGPDERGMMILDGVDRESLMADLDWILGATAPAKPTETQEYPAADFRRNLDLELLEKARAWQAGVEDGIEWARGGEAKERVPRNPYVLKGEVKTS